MSPAAAESAPTRPQKPSHERGHELVLGQVGSPRTNTQVFCMREAAFPITTTDISEYYTRPFLRHCASDPSASTISTNDRAIMRAARQFQLKARLALPHATTDDRTVYVCTAQEVCPEYVVSAISHHAKWAVLAHDDQREVFRRLCPQATHMTIKEARHKGAENMVWIHHGIRPAPTATKRQRTLAAIAHTQAGPRPHTPPDEQPRPQDALSPQATPPSSDDSRPQDALSPQATHLSSDSSRPQVAAAA